jgi:uncharacterized protein (TIGR03437 family)
MRALIFLLALLPSSFVPAWSGALTGIVTLPPATDTGFFARLDSNGNLVYATYLNGSSLALPQFSPRFLGITTDASGNAYLTGQGLFGSTPGALPLVNSYGSGFFVIKLDATGKIVFTTAAVGGTSIAVDGQNSCNNPATAGSSVTLFVNGLGLAGGEPATGAIATAPATPLSLPVVVNGDAALVSAESDPGSVNGVWAIRVQVTPEEPQSSVALASISLTIGSVAVRDSLILWVTPAP